VDRFCLTDGRHIRVGYSPRTGRAAMVLTGSRRYAVRDVRPGTTAGGLRARLPRRAVSFTYGANTWHFVKGRRSRLVFRVRGDVVREVGLAGLGVTATPRLARRFARTYDP
jgi:hypothetical protein